MTKQDIINLVVKLGFNMLYIDIDNHYKGIIDNITYNINITEREVMLRDKKVLFHFFKLDKQSDGAVIMRRLSSDEYKEIYHKIVDIFKTKYRQLKIDNLL